MVWVHATLTNPQAIVIEIKALTRAAKVVRRKNNQTWFMGMGSKGLRA